MTLEEVAAKSGLSRSYIGRLEAEDGRNPTVAAATRLARGLGVDVTELLSAAGFTSNNDSNRAEDMLDPELRLFFAGEWKDLTDDEKDWLKRTIRMIKDRKAQRQSA